MHFFLHIPMKKRINMHFSPIYSSIFLREKGSVPRRGTTRSSTRNYKSLYGKSTFSLPESASYANSLQNSNHSEIE
jgi:hypothetical protein